MAADEKTKAPHYAGLLYILACSGLLYILACFGLLYILAYYRFWPVLAYYIFRPILVYFIFWPILIYYIFWPIVAHSSLNRDYRQFCSFNREGSNFRVISAGAGSERALLSRARVSGRKGSFEQTSPCLAIRSPHRQTTKGEPLSSELVDEHITIHCIFVLNKFLLKPKGNEHRHLIHMLNS